MLDPPPSLAAIAALTQSLVHYIVYPLSLPSFPSPLTLIPSFLLFLQPQSPHLSALEVDTLLDRVTTEAAPMDISATRDHAARHTNPPPPSHVSIIDVIVCGICLYRTLITMISH